MATDESYTADDIAMKLVSERHAKRDLVNLVRWLLLGGVEIVKKDHNINIK